ncbi:hypothetical protein BD560DRAFT_456281 [Blakeslea trispora]|nr:hypothetical protein BD560DRAFT_456281 [Blakeslea trispora]
MKDRAHFLQAQFLLRSLHLPSDTLLYRLLPHIRPSSSHSTWYPLSKSPLWRKCQPNIDSSTRRSLYRLYMQERHDDLIRRQSSHKHVLLSHCRTKIIDPILWSPMTHGERSRCIRWRFGWLPSGLSTSCPRHPHRSLTKSHAIRCLQMHHRLMMPESVGDPLSFLLNILSTRRPRSFAAVIPWTIRWPAICTILYELDYLQHSKIPPPLPSHLEQRLLAWFPSPSSNDMITSSQTV